MKTSVRYNVIIAIQVLLAASHCIYSQNLTKQSISDVQDLIFEKSWNAGKSKLDKMLINFSDSVDRAKIYFSYAYLYDLYSRDSILNQNALLDSSLYYYRQVANLQPENYVVYNNMALVYLRQGSEDMAIEALHDALAANPPNPWDYFNKIGDINKESENFDSALYYYEKAVESNPFYKTSHQRIIDVVDFYSSLEKKFDYTLALIELQFFDLAARVLENLIQLQLVNSEPNALKSLVLWLDCQNKLTYIHPQMLSLLPADWNHQAKTELTDLLTTDSIDNISLKWWRKGEEYLYGDHYTLKANFVIGETLRLIAKEKLKTYGLSNINVSEQYYIKSLDLITRGKPEELLINPKEIPKVYFDVAGELGVLYTKFLDEIDRDTSKFNALEYQMFFAKRVAYMNLNSNAIHNFSSTLGFIYAYRNQWEQINYPYGKYRNGIYQLKNAIRRAPEGKNIGNLHRLLAEGYIAISELKKARRSYAMGGLSSLNNDNLTRAKKLYEKAHNLPGNPKELNLLGDLILLNEMFEKFDSNDLVRSEIIINVIDNFPVRTNRKLRYNLAVQKLKILADIGVKARDYDLLNSSRLFHSEALLIASAIEYLPTIGDLNRMHQIRNTILSAIQISANYYLPIDPSQKKLSADLKSEVVKWYIFLPGDTEPSPFIINEDILLGAKIINAFEKKGFEIDYLPDLEIYNNAIIIKNSEENKIVNFVEWIKNLNTDKKIELVNTL